MKMAEPFGRETAFAILAWISGNQIPAGIIVVSPGGMWRPSLMSVSNENGAAISSYMHDQGAVISVWHENAFPRFHNGEPDTWRCHRGFDPNRPWTSISGFVHTLWKSRVIFIPKRRLWSSALQEKYYAWKRCRQPTMPQGCAMKMPAAGW